jgi:hypothetical protein
MDGLEWNGWGRWVGEKAKRLRDPLRILSEGGSGPPSSDTNEIKPRMLSVSTLMSDKLQIPSLSPLSLFPPSFEILSSRTVPGLTEPPQKFDIPTRPAVA